MFSSRIHDSPHLDTRPYAQILEGWNEELGVDLADYGTLSMRRTKATLIHERTKELRAVQLLLGHSKLESTVRYLGIEVDDALEICDQTEIGNRRGRKPRGHQTRIVGRAAFWRGRELALSAMSGAGGRPV